MMKLKFLLQKNAWFIEHDGSWYCVQDEEQMCIAATALPLIVVDQHTMITQPHLAGRAQLVCEEPAGESRFFRKDKNRSVAVVRVTLTEPDGTPVIERCVPLDVRALGSVEWLTRPFRDGWLDASASLSLDNVQRLELQAFLPKAPDSTGKTLTIHNQTDGTSSEVWLERARNNVVPLISGGRRGKIVLRLECEPEAVDSLTDTRQLGFVLLGESVEAA